MFKFIHAADIHLDSPLHRLDAYEGAPVDELRRATRRAFDNLVQTAINEKAAFVLIAGDLYDGDWRDYNTGLYFVSQTSRLRDAGIPVYIVAGNHDAASKITKNLRFPDNVHLFPAEKPATLKVAEMDVAIHGQSFATAAVKKDLSLNYPAAAKGCFNIGLLHTCLTGRAGHEPYAPCTLDGLRAKGYNYWALGHVHRHEIILQDPLTVFPGNLQGRNIRETGPKGCVLVAVDDDGQTTPEFKSQDVIRWLVLDVDASGAAEGYEVVDRFTRALETALDANESLPLVTRVVIQGETRAHDDLAASSGRWVNEIRAAAIDAGGGKVWVEKVKLAIHPPFSGGTYKSPDGAIGELLAVLDELEADPVARRELARELDDLAKKLPRELKEGSDGLAVDDPVWLQNILDRVRPMLLRRMLRKEESG